MEDAIQYLLIGLKVIIILCRIEQLDQLMLMQKVQDRILFFKLVKKGLMIMEN